MAYNVQLVLEGLNSLCTVLAAPSSSLFLQCTSGHSPCMPLHIPLCSFCGDLLFHLYKHLPYCPLWFEHSFHPKGGTDLLQPLTYPSYVGCTISLVVLPQGGCLLLLVRCPRLLVERTGSSSLVPQETRWPGRLLLDAAFWPSCWCCHRSAVLCCTCGASLP